jgi:hypothetical protein
MLDTYVAHVRKANAAANTYRELTSSKNDVVAHVINTSDDETIVRFREWRDALLAQIAKAQNELDAKTTEVRGYAETLAPTEETTAPEDVKAEYLKTRKSLTDMRAGLVQFFGADVVNEALAGVEELTGLRGSSRMGGGTGVKRPRLESATVNGEPVPVGTTGMPTFTTMAAYVSKNVGKVSAADLKDAAFKAAGTSDLSEKAGETIAYSFEVPGAFEGKNAVISVEIVPRAANEAASESENEDEAED